MRHLKDDLALSEVLITLFAFITAPVSANLMAQAALHLRLRSMSGNVPETLDRPLPCNANVVIYVATKKI
jgi:multisubunit Na+/H+ antiporter MnhG subunit